MASGHRLAALWRVGSRDCAGVLCLGSGLSKLPEGPRGWPGDQRIGNSVPLKLETTQCFKCEWGHGETRSHRCGEHSGIKNERDNTERQHYQALPSAPRVSAMGSKQLSKCCGKY